MITFNLASDDGHCFLELLLSFHVVAFSRSSRLGYICIGSGSRHHKSIFEESGPLKLRRDLQHYGTSVLMMI